MEYKMKKRAQTKLAEKIDSANRKHRAKKNDERKGRPARKLSPQVRPVGEQNSQYATAENDLESVGLPKI